MIQHFKPAAMLLLCFTVLTGVIYPVIVTGLAQLLLPNQANGSFLANPKGQILGSQLIGQSFSETHYFWGRPSATSPYAYNAGASSGSNLAATSSVLADAIKMRIQTLKAADPNNTTAIPIDLITASASGLDPHISPAAAQYQVQRVAKARHIAPEKLHALIESYIEARQWGFLGEPRINVLQLNLALDSLSH